MCVFFQCWRKSDQHVLTFRGQHRLAKGSELVLHSSASDGGRNRAPQVRSIRQCCLKGYRNTGNKNVPKSLCLMAALQAKYYLPFPFLPVVISSTGEWLLPALSLLLMCFFISP